MADALRKFWPTGVLFLVGLGFDLSPLRSDLVAYVLWALAALWALYAGIPQIKRIRVGLKPLDAELREALEARDRWREHFEAKQSEVEKLNQVREQQLHKIREVEQEIQRLRDRNEQLDQLNKNLQAERNQLSDLLQETKRENSELRESSDKSGPQFSPQEIAERRIGYHDSPIRLMDLLEVAGDNGVLRDFEFEHCILEGPGVINLEGPFPKSNSVGSMVSSLPTHCRVEGSPDTTLLQVAHHSKPPVGVIHLSGYKFEAVTFRGLGFMGTPEHLEHLKSRLAFSKGSTDE